MWDVAGFPFCMRDKSSATLPHHYTTLVLFSATKNCAISVAISSLNCLFFEDVNESPDIFTHFISSMFLHMFTDCIGGKY